MKLTNLIKESTNPVAMGFINKFKKSNVHIASVISTYLTQAANSNSTVTDHGDTVLKSTTKEKVRYATTGMLSPLLSELEISAEIVYSEDEQICIVKYTAQFQLMSGGSNGMQVAYKTTDGGSTWNPF